MNSRTSIFRWLAVLLMTAGSLQLVGCPEDSPGDDLGDALEEAGDEVRDAGEDAVDAVEDTVDDVGDELDD